MNDNRYGYAARAYELAGNKDKLSQLGDMLLKSGLLGSALRIYELADNKMMVTFIKERLIRIRTSSFYCYGFNFSMLVIGYALIGGPLFSSTSLSLSLNDILALSPSDAKSGEPHPLVSIPPRMDCIDRGRLFTKSKWTCYITIRFTVTFFSDDLADIIFT